MEGPSFLSRAKDSWTEWGTEVRRRSWRLGPGGMATVSGLVKATGERRQAQGRWAALRTAVVICGGSAG